VWFLIAIHLPFVVFTPLVTITRHPDAQAGEIALIALGASRSADFSSGTAWPPPAAAAPAAGR
jgi:hypothetical protein